MATPRRLRFPSACLLPLAFSSALVSPGSTRESNCRGLVQVSRVYSGAGEPRVSEIDSLASLEHDSRRGTPGQLVRGTVDGQVADDRIDCF